MKKFNLVIAFLLICVLTFISFIIFSLVISICQMWQYRIIDFTSIGGVDISPIKIRVSNYGKRNFSYSTESDEYISTGPEDFAYPMAVDMLDLVQKVKDNSSINVSPINNFDFQYLITNHDKCISSGPRKTDFVILVKSAPFNNESRMLIRETWGRENCWRSLNMKLFFLIGNSPSYNKYIDTENEQYRDIIQQEFYDDYYNNTYKLVMGFHWVLTYCPMVRDVLFVDDDYFVHPHKVERYLQSLSEAYRKRHVAGMVYLNSKPFRTSKGFYGKWYVDMKDYPWDSYPPYLAAGTIFISSKLIRDILIAMHYTLYIRFDDIFLGLVLHKLLIKPVHLNNVYSEKRVSLQHRSVYENVLTSHGFKNKELMLKFWNKLKCNDYCLR